MTATARIWLVVVIAWLTALFPARVAGWLLTLYATHGGTVSAAMHVALPSLEWVLVYLVAGALYLQVRSLRGIILVAALAWAVIGFLRMPGYIHNLSTFNLWHNVLAEGLWETFGCATIASAAAFDLVAERRSTR